MRQVGSFLFIIGILAIGLNFLDRVPTLLAWIYQWGEPTAWSIKIGLVVVGGALWLLGGRGAEEPEA